MARGLQASPTNVRIVTRNNPPITKASNAATEPIYRGAFLSFNSATGKNVCKQAPSTTEFRSFVGSAGVSNLTADGHLGTPATRGGLIPVFREFSISNLRIDGTPEPGEYVYLKTRADKQSDNPWQDSEEFIPTGTDFVFNNASATVTATNSVFTEELNVGDQIYNAADDAATATRTIASIESDTSLTLSGDYIGTAGTASAKAMQVSELTTEEGEEIAGSYWLNLPVGQITRRAAPGVARWDVNFSVKIAAMLTKRIGAIDVTHVDTLGAIELNVGRHRATAVNIGRTGQNTNIKGNLIAEEEFRANNVDARSAGPLTLGAHGDTTDIELVKETYLNGIAYVAHPHIPTDATRNGEPNPAPPGGTIAVTENGTPTHHITTIVLNQLRISAAGVNFPAAMGNEALGVLLYTFPDKIVHLRSARVSIEAQGTSTINAIAADTPEIALGSAEAPTAGAQPTLQATEKDIVDFATSTGAVAVQPDCDGTVETQNIVDEPVIINEGTIATRQVYLNVADGWADADDGLEISGTIILVWDCIN